MWIWNRTYSSWLVAGIFLLSIVSASVAFADPSVLNDDPAGDGGIPYAWIKIGSADGLVDYDGAVSDSQSWLDGATTILEGMGSADISVGPHGTVKAKAIKRRFDNSSLGMASQTFKPFTISSSAGDADGTVIPTTVQIDFNGLMAVETTTENTEEVTSRVEFMVEMLHSSGTPVLNTADGDSEVSYEGQVLVVGDNSGTPTVSTPATFSTGDTGETATNRWTLGGNLTAQKYDGTNAVALGLSIEEKAAADAYRTENGGDVTVYYVEYTESVDFNAVVGDTYGTYFDMLAAAEASEADGADADTFVAADFWNTATYSMSGANLVFAVASPNYSQMGQTPNQESLGAALEELSGASGDMGTVLSELQDLGDSAAIANAMEQMDGQMNGGLSAAGVQTAGQINTQLTAQLRPSFNQAPAPSNATAFAFKDGKIVLRAQDACCPSWNEWTASITGFGLGGAIHGDANTAGVGVSAGGTIINVQRDMNATDKLGFIYSFSRSFSNSEPINSAATVDSHAIGGYIKREVCNRYTVLTGTIGPNTYNTSRHVQFGGIDRIALGTHDGWQSSIYVEEGYSFDGCGWQLQPYWALQHVYLRQNAYNEVGAGSLNLSIGGIDLHSFRGTLGTRLSHDLPTRGCRSANIEWRTAWIHEFLDETTGAFSAQFGTTGSPSFAVQGADLGRDWVLMGTTLNIGVGYGAQLFVAYDLNFNARQTTHIGSGGIEWTW